VSDADLSRGLGGVEVCPLCAGRGVLGKVTVLPPALMLSRDADAFAAALTREVLFAAHARPCARCCGSGIDASLYDISHWVESLLSAGTFLLEPAWRRCIPSVEKVTPGMQLVEEMLARVQHNLVEFALSDAIGRFTLDHSEVQEIGTAFFELRQRTLRELEL
jgi:hypothetical protein